MGRATVSKYPSPVAIAFAGLLASECAERHEAWSIRQWSACLWRRSFMLYKYGRASTRPRWRAWLNASCFGPRWALKTECPRSRSWRSVVSQLSQPSTGWTRS